MNVNKDDRFGYFLLGCVLGLVVGYTIKGLRNNDPGEAGMIRLPSFHDLKELLARLKSVRLKSWALFLVVGLSVFASFQTNAVNQDLRANDAADQRQQKQIEQISRCNSEFLGKTIVALNERTTYTVDAAKSNVNLQREQLKLLTFAFALPPPRPEEGREAFGRYIQRLNKFIDLAKKTAGKAANNPYPTLDEFEKCVNKEAS